MSGKTLKEPLGYRRIKQWRSGVKSNLEYDGKPRPKERDFLAYFYKIKSHKNRRKLKKMEDRG